MKETPILMCGDMVRATLANVKTETRRVAKPFHSSVYDIGWCSHVWEQFSGFQGEWSWRNPHTRQKPCIYAVRCPYGAPGDRLWVRETWAPSHMASSEFLYRADPLSNPQPERWFPSIHMPRRASRIALEITNIRVERVQKITAAGAMAEGIGVDDGQMRETPNFRELWDSLNAKRNNGIYAWAKNPWVWAITFKKL